jgi:GNAT superfamily N-acetyltransferase
VLRSEGLRTLYFTILGETVYRRLLLFEAPTGDRLRPAPGLESLEFAYLSAGEVGQDPLPGQSGEIVAHRLRRGDRCLCARRAGRLVAYRWIGLGETLVEYLGCTLRLAEGVAYVYDAYTVPEARGLGLSAVLWARYTERLAEEGCHTTLAAILPENRAARRAAAKLPFRRVGRVWYVQLGPWRRYFLRSPTRSVALAS